MFSEKLILIVDDSDGDALLLTLMFKKARIQNPVMVLGHGVQAMAYLNGDGAYADRTKYPLPEVLFLDLKMPMVDGYGIMDFIKRQPALSRSLVVALSGLNRASDIERAYQMGAGSFLSKPCTLEDLANLQKTFPGFWKVSPASGSSENPTQPAL